MLICFVIECLFFLSVKSENNCLYSYTYWKSNIDKLPLNYSSLKICNNSLLWIDLLNIDPLKLSFYNNINWLLYFQQVSISIFNYININNNTNYFNDSLIGNSLLFLLNELEYYCYNISNFLNNNYKNRLSNEIQLIYFYNIGLLEGGPSRCNESYSEANNTIKDYQEAKEFIYINNNSYNIIDYNNNTIIKNTYKIQVILLISISILLFLIFPILIIYIILISNPNKQYYFINPLSQERSSNSSKETKNNFETEEESNSDNIKYDIENKI